MRIHYPAAWPKLAGIEYMAPTISLDKIVPIPGQPASVFFDWRDRLPEHEVVTLLWKPPMSAINGWGCQPSEIAQSFLVTARVIGTERLEVREPGGHWPNGCRHELDVVSRERFLPKLLQLKDEQDSRRSSGIADFTAFSPQNLEQLDRVHWSGTALIDGLTYISATTYTEGVIELIVCEDGPEFIGLFCASDDPGVALCDLERRRLSGRERDALRRTIQQSEPMMDSFTPYLIA